MCSQYGAGRSLFDPKVFLEVIQRAATQLQDRKAEERRVLRACWATVTGLKAPTLDRLLRHAKLYGSDLVFETAEDFLSTRELMTLKAKLNELTLTPRKRTRRPRLFGKRR